jgi:hypothetical protein
MATKRTDTVVGAVLVAVEAAAVVLLHQLGRARELQVPLDDLKRWLDTTDPELATIAGARLVALGLAWWLLGSSLLYLGARGLRRDVVTAAIGALTLRATRRVLDRMFVAGVLVTALTRAPVATAGPLPEPAGVSIEPRSGRVDDAPASLRGAVRDGRDLPASHDGQPFDPALPSRDPAPAKPAPAGPSPTAGYVVVSGDSLWLIAARIVAPPSPSTSDVPAIAPYWRLLVEANRDSLRSGDPNLIFPGESVRLP